MRHYINRLIYYLFHKRIEEHEFYLQMSKDYYALGLVYDDESKVNELKGQVEWISKAKLLEKN